MSVMRCVWLIYVIEHHKALENGCLVDCRGVDEIWATPVVCWRWRGGYVVGLSYKLRAKVLIFDWKFLGPSRVLISSLWTICDLPTAMEFAGDRWRRRARARRKGSCQCHCCKLLKTLLEGRGWSLWVFNRAHVRVADTLIYSISLNLNLLEVERKREKKGCVQRRVAGEMGGTRSVTRVNQGKISGFQNCCII